MKGLRVIKYLQINTGINCAISSIMHIYNYQYFESIFLKLAASTFQSLFYSLTASTEPGSIQFHSLAFVALYQIFNSTKQEKPFSILITWTAIEQNT